MLIWQKIGFSIIVFLLALFVPLSWPNNKITEKVGEAIFRSRELSERLRFRAELTTRKPVNEIPVPVIGVSKRQIADTYGAPRGSNRRHEGIDIFAARGTYIRSATEGVVLRIANRGLGGKYVFVLGPGGERYYYAHLDSIDPMLEVGQIVTDRTLLGTVGNTGNAAGTAPHLHFGLYGSGGAQNPFPRLTDAQALD